MKTEEIRELIKQKVGKQLKTEVIKNLIERVAILENMGDGHPMKRIYFAHPYNNEESNKTKIEAIIRSHYVPGMIPISPIHSFGFMYIDYPYEEGLYHCLTLLNDSDEIWMFGDWKNSKGCRLEHGYAVKHNIKIRYFN